MESYQRCEALYCALNLGVGILCRLHLSSVSNCECLYDRYAG
jgi:hypothetical protein